MESIKELIKEKKFKEASETCQEWLINHDYVYSQVFGWEKASVVEMFKLNPHATAIPTEMKPVWIEVKEKGEEFPKHVQHPTQKKLAPTDSYLAFIEYRKARNAREMAEKSVPLPEY